MEHAVLYFKPQFNAPDLLKFVEDSLLAQGVSVVQRTILTGTDISRRNIFEKQYLELVKYSTELSALLLELTEDECEAFKQAFTRDFAEVKANLPVTTTSVSSESTVRRPPSGMSNAPRDILLNFDEAKRYLNVENRELLALSRSDQALSLRLRKGIYCCRIDKTCTKSSILKGKLSEPIYVINPFFGSLRDSYVSGNAAIPMWVIEWDAQLLKWSTLTDDIIGHRNPEAATPTSIRGVVFSEWPSLGLHEAPNEGRNILHISRSALEGLAERMIWARNAMVFTDLFGSRLMTARCTSAQIAHWLGNPAMTVKVEVEVEEYSNDSNESSVFRKTTKLVPTTLFNILAGKNSEECISYLVHISKI